MFGLFERARLAMHERTLSGAIADAREGSRYMFADRYPIAMSGAAAYLCEWIGRQRPGTSLWEIISEVPPSLLKIVDTTLLRAADMSLRDMDDKPGYHAFTILSGLVMSRVIEVSRPSLARRAVQYRVAALKFAEPLYERGMAIPLTSFL